MRPVALLERHHQTSGHHFARRAWVATALIPAGLVLATALAFVGGERGDNANRFAGAALALVGLAAPTAAVIFALLARRAHEHSATAVLTVAAVLAVVAFVALALLVVSGEALLIAAAVYLGGIVLVDFTRGHRPRPRRG